MARQEERIFYRPYKELKKLQEAKLHHYVNTQLYPFSTNYRNLFDNNKIKPSSIKTIDDLRRIPFTSKADMIPKPDEDPTEKNLSYLIKPDADLIKKYLPKKKQIELLLTKKLRGEEHLQEKLATEYYPIFLTATTGTTQMPISFLYTNYDLENLKLYGRRLLNIFGADKGDKVANIFPYAPHLAFWQVFFGGIATNTFIISTGGGKTIGTEGNINTIRKVKPQFLMGVPSYVYHLLKKAHEKNFDLSYIKKIVLGAGRVPPGFKVKIANLLQDMNAKDVSVFGTYGFTEARTAWGECPTALDESSGYHTYPDQEIFEIIDSETGEVKREGEDGELVYTNIDARGTVVFRYRTGDLIYGGIKYEPCPHCGRTVARISSNITRASNIKNFQITKIKGALVDLNHVELLLDDCQDIYEWQIEVRKKDNDPYEVDELVLFASLMNGVSEESFRDKLNREVCGKTELSFNDIQVVSQEEIQNRIGIESNLKAKKIIDNRPKE